MHVHVIFLISDFSVHIESFYPLQLKSMDLNFMNSKCIFPSQFFSLYIVLSLVVESARFRIQVCGSGSSLYPSPDPHNW